MNAKKIFDILCSVVLPIIIGAVIYYWPGAKNIVGFLRNQLPDGLWAYAFFSAVLIIWQRQVNVFWMAIVAIVYILFELFQYFHFINGTGDLLDVLIYFIFSGVALIPNQLLKNSIYYKPKPTTLYAT